MFILSNVIGACLAEISVTDSEDVFSKVLHPQLAFEGSPRPLALLFGCIERIEYLAEEQHCPKIIEEFV